MLRLNSLVLLPDRTVLSLGLQGTIIYHILRTNGLCLLRLCASQAPGNPALESVFNGSPPPHSQSAWLLPGGTHHLYILPASRFVLWQCNPHQCWDWLLKRPRDSSNVFPLSHVSGPALQAFGCLHTFRV